MRNLVAPLKNVQALGAAFEALATRDQGVPGMGLVHGYTGAGKTTAITQLVNRTHGVYVRATSAWSMTSMLATVMKELGADPLYRKAAMLDFVGDKLLNTQRPLFVDEADYLLHQRDLLECLRDVHDVSGVPVVLIGMRGIETKLVHKPQLARRISHWVEFLPSDLDDARRLTEAVCEVQIDDELLTQLHAQAKGGVGLMVVGLSRIEALAKANGWKHVSAAQWGTRRLFLGNRPANQGL